MPKYRIISELDPGTEHRDSRGTRLRLDEQRLVTIVDATSLAEVAVDARDTEPHRERRIISIEETHPSGFSYTNEEIAYAFGFNKPAAEQPFTDLTRFDDDDSPLYGSAEFTDVVCTVVEGLRESGLVPGLDISVLDNEMDEPYAMVEVFDDARGIYLSRGTEIRRLTDDRDAAGRIGVLAIAQAVVAFSNDLH